MKGPTGGDEGTRQPSGQGLGQVRSPGALPRYPRAFGAMTEMVERGLGNVELGTWPKDVRAGLVRTPEDGIESSFGSRTGRAVEHSVPEVSGSAS